MARKPELTRMPLAKGLTPKWRKIYKGKNYYFRGSYQEALTAWEKKKVEIDEEAQPRKPYSQVNLEKMKLWFLQNGQPEAAKDVMVDVPLAWDGISEAGRCVWMERFRQMGEQQTGNKKPTIHAAVEMFLARQHAKVSGGQITAGRYDTLQRCCRHFAAFVGQTASVERINGH